MSDAAIASIISPAQGAQQLCINNFFPLFGNVNFGREKFSTEKLFIKHVFL